MKKHVPLTCTLAAGPSWPQVLHDDLLMESRITLEATIASGSSVHCLRAHSVLKTGLQQGTFVH
eukprot:CAMPEP_0170622816 /NCGR_PEP_ID=MMETSP0224-20130122/29341_1 /TAXON_ID=285029 /ORGANISM="Togula jolla, Strain CCCM 725" /LENGTH=63 /DNA_ID=CAMNT_0010949177 /DNA_START=42 /DNA_END=233 /DNA_ORIENTATION=+